MKKRGLKKRGGKEDDDDEDDQKPREIVLPATPPGTPEDCSVIETSFGSQSGLDHTSQLATVAPANAALATRSLGNRANSNSKQQLALPEQAQPVAFRPNVWRSEVVFLVLTFVISLGVFIATVLPLTALVALMSMVASSTATFYVLIRWGQREFQHMLETNGIGPYLPQSLYYMLAQESVHEFLTEDDGSSFDIRYYILYFLPGLSNEQLNGYIDQLTPQHQARLRRPGLGNLLGPDFMRPVLGEQGMAQISGGRAAMESAQQQQPNRPPRRQQPPTIEVIAEDDETTLVESAHASSSESSDLGLDVSDLVGVNEQTAQQTARTLGLSEMEPATAQECLVNEGEEEEEEEEEEEDVSVSSDEDLADAYNARETRALRDATAESLQDEVLTPLHDFATSIMRDVAHTIAAVGLTVLAGSLGVRAYRRGSFSLPPLTSVLPHQAPHLRSSSSTRTTQLSLPSSPVLWTSIAVSTGLALFYRSFYGGWSRREPKSENKGGKTNKQSSNKKKR